jgi:hypothetical protein
MADFSIQKKQQKIGKLWKGHGSILDRLKMQWTFSAMGVSGSFKLLAICRATLALAPGLQQAIGLFWALTVATHGIDLKALPLKKSN